jgi:hypothetical protein
MAILGVLNGEIEWLFAFPNRLSVTINNADRPIDRPRDELAARSGVRRQRWTDPSDLPPWQIVKEKRATPGTTPAQNARRPDQAPWSVNVMLAGDWIQTGLPATIERGAFGLWAASIVIGSGGYAKTPASLQ